MIQLENIMDGKRKYRKVPGRGNSVKKTKTDTSTKAHNDMKKLRGCEGQVGEVISKSLKCYKIKFTLGKFTHHPTSVPSCRLNLGKHPQRQPF
jgi:hypothetical protein